MCECYVASVKSNPLDYSLPGYSVHGILQARGTGVGFLALFQGIFLTQGSNPRLLHLLHWPMGSLRLAPPEKPFLKDSHSYLLIITENYYT